eukprot:TRINITY_DN50780_c0_g1_i1.p1 TRINITY_DN50780_c0_g1~~TRINITY_DN50780_c0_g1_i1.p1  ORF type:complete len:103 (-),score=22.07 TRINITY_DN50780_c0_g1_i1:216-524(-)
MTQQLLQAENAAAQKVREAKEARALRMKAAEAEAAEFVRKERAHLEASFDLEEKKGASSGTKDKDAVMGQAQREIGEIRQIAAKRESMVVDLLFDLVTTTNV